LSAGFVNYDDTGLFVDNPPFRGLALENLRWMFTTALAGHWAPLTWVSHGLDYVSSGLDPHAFHRTNLLLHAANAAMFCALAAKLLAIARPREAESNPNALWIAAGAAALLFGVHPLRAETVAVDHGAARTPLHVLLPARDARLPEGVRPGTVRSPRGLVRHLDRPPRLRAPLEGLGLAFVSIIVVLDLYPLRRPLVRDVWVQKLPFFALGLASAITSSWAANFLPGTMKSLDEWGIRRAPRHGDARLAYYVEKTVWPTRLAALVELPYRFDFAAPAFVATAIGVVVAAVAIVVARKRAPALAAASAVYVLRAAPRARAPASRPAARRGAVHLPRLHAVGDPRRRRNPARADARPRRAPRHGARGGRGRDRRARPALARPGRDLEGQPIALRARDRRRTALVGRLREPRRPRPRGGRPGERDPALRDRRRDPPRPGQGLVRPRDPLRARRPPRGRRARRPPGRDVDEAPRSSRS
jgi:hypothetical protein